MMPLSMLPGLFGLLDLLNFNSFIPNFYDFLDQSDFLIDKISHFRFISFKTNIFFEKMIKF